MIDVLAVIKTKDESINLFGHIDENLRSIVLNFRTNPASEFTQEILCYSKMNLQVADMNGQTYSIYGCKFTQCQTAWAPVAISSITGHFDRLIKERYFSCSYTSVSFTFDGIENIFPLEHFETQFEEDALLQFTKEKKNNLVVTLPNNVECLVHSAFSGIQKSDRLFDLNIVQSKHMTLRFQSELSVDNILNYVKKVKQYFEFVLKQEILLSSISFTHVSDPHKYGSLIYDPILQPTTIVRKVKEQHKATADLILLGLAGWMEHYESYSRVIQIWKKTIYNAHVSDEDLFIWRCQAFELLCTLTEPIYTAALSLMAKNQHDPNLRNFLQASNNLYHFSPEMNAQFFADIKNVRDKLTHNNPKKEITERQIKNSYCLIEYFLIKTLCEIMYLSGIPTGYMLEP